MEKSTVLRTTGRPLQKIPWSQKIKDKKAWFRQNADYLMSISLFQGGGSTSAVRGGRDMKMLYDVYNNKFPATWFTHFTNPLSATNAQHTKFPAKIRPVTILRSNIDFLLAEFNNRPTNYQVQNLGEDGYIAYTEELNKTINANLWDHFYQEFLRDMEAQGISTEEAPSPEDIRLPAQIETEMAASYKDKKAIKGQKWLNRAKREYEIKRQWLKMFKDWLIVGEAYVFRGFRHGEFFYERVSPLDIDYDKSPDFDFIEDGQWIVRRRMLTIADVVDDYYDKLKPGEIDYMEAYGPWYAPNNMYDHLQTIYQNNHIPVYHIQWKGFKQIQYVDGVDPQSGQPYENVEDEDYVLAPWEKLNKKEWVTEWYETTRLTDTIYVDMQPIPVQRNAMSSFSSNKSNYNGRRYSDTHSSNISVLELGIPFQILFIIVNYVKEKTLARSKGKVMMMDFNAIPRTKGWSEEKFFYYIEAMGFGLLNRHQQGVDRSWNQFSVQDMSLFDQIGQLLEMEMAIKQNWDDTLGISRQRKGQTYASDLQGVNERAVFQSSLMTDMIFIPFEELQEREMQAVMDYGKYINAGGFRGLYNEDLTRTELLNIEPEDFTNASFGVFAVRSKELQDTLDGLKANVQAMLQNGTKPSTIFDIYTASSLPELRAILTRAENTMAAEGAAAAEQQQANALELEEMKKALMTFESDLEARNLNLKYDREERLAWTTAEAEAAFQEPDEAQDAATGQMTPNEIAKDQLAREKMQTQERMQDKALAATAAQKSADREQKTADRESREKIARQRPKGSKTK